MKSKLDIVNTIVTVSVVFILATYLGALGRNHFVKPDISIEQTVVVKADKLPLKNGGEVIIQKIGNDKVVYMSYEDLQYVSKKVKIKKLVKDIAGLFARMEE